METVILTYHHRVWRIWDTVDGFRAAPESECQKYVMNPAKVLYFPSNEYPDLASVVEYLFAKK